MGRAIVRQPQVFLMDEPLSNLDAKLRVQMRAEIARIQHELGVTTIYVTHDQVEAMTMGDRVAVMRKGELQQIDAPQTLYDQPVNLFVASFIGSPSMNLLEADLERQNGGLAVRLGDQSIPVPEQIVGRHPSVESYVGKRLALGIRPEQLEDAAVDGEGARLHGKVLLTEALGSELMAHVEIAATPVTRDEVVEGAVEDIQEAELAVDLLTTDAHGQKTALVARFDAASRARPDEEIEVAVDTRKLHFFDLETGEAI
jgi:multiple sugar transport system ATP-binding protein